ncbi:MAG TPA: tetratricopeptide repeat protein, partial [Longimicrobiaceae bacterium]|nr:tetratricopeptide repeat protein [Longimicrobiaceae bacterium]
LWALLLLLLGGGAFAWWVGTQREPRTAGRPLDELPDSIPADTLAADTLAPGAEAVDALVANQEGLRFMEQGDYATALAQFERAVQLAPDNAEFHGNLGSALLRLGRPDEALAQLRRSVSLDPGRVVSYNQLADAALAAGDTTGAIAALERYIELSTFERGRQVAEQRVRALRDALVARPDTLPLDTVPQLLPQEPPPPPAQPRRASPRDTIIIP